MSGIAYSLVLVRHGHSEWNLCHRFTGWTDIAITEIGLNEAALAGKCLAKQGYHFDEVHVSALQRTRQTADAILSAMAHSDIPYHQSWRLNERHYGQLQGLNKDQIFESWGEENSRRWWRGYCEPPPQLEVNDSRHPSFDPLYADIDPALLPLSESLEQCQQRLLPYWHKTVVPLIRSNRNLLIISHGNTLRSLCMYLEKISAEDIEKVEIPSAVPLVYHFDGAFNLIKKQWLEI